MKKTFQDKILELYLNAVPLAGSNYGIESAGRNFFGKNSSDLSLAEAAISPVWPKPTYYSHGSHQEELAKRKDFVLGKMAGLGFVAPEEAEAAKERSLLQQK